MRTETEGEWYCDDARNIETGAMPDFDLLCAGFPCQAFSIAGKRAGFSDARGTLFFEVARLVADKRPAYFLLENVPGLLSHDKGRTFLAILSTFSELGYHVEWKVLNSKDFGVPQSRKRVYIIGYLDGRCAGKILPVPVPNGAALIQVLAGSQGKRVYDPAGVSCTLTSQAGGMGGKTGLYEVGIPIKENTKKGYKMAYPGDSIDLGYANLNTRRGRVGHEIAHTLTTESQQGTVHFVRQYREPFLRTAFDVFTEKKGQEETAYKEFASQEWVYEYGVFRALKKANNGECWNDWPEEYRTWPENRQKLPAEVETEAQYQMFLQYIFYTQWMKVKKAANDAGIQIMGDVPFYVGQDSVDVWGGKDNFLLDTDGRPIFIAGVPPDYFSATGQRWGNPIYDWEHMKEQDYRFWVDRIGYSNKLFDIIRIDHFRAFDTYWKIPADCPTAIDGEWIEAPGYEVIDTLQKEIPGLDLVAEDLGLLRPEVLMLKDHYHLKGMKILIFSIETGGKYARDTFHDVENMIFYTGTHDNDTIMQWYGNMSAAARRKIRRMLKKAGASQGSVKDRFLQYTMQNQAEYAIIPLADILGLGKEGHINTPGTIGSPNWEWHLPDFIQAKKELQKFGRLIVDTKR